MATLNDVSEIARLIRAETTYPLLCRLGFGLILLAGSGFLTGLAPLALKHMIDIIFGTTTNREWDGAASALAAGSVYLLIACGGRAMADLRPVVTGATEQELCARVSRKFFSHLLDLNLAFHIDRQMGEVSQSLQQAVLGVQLILACLLNTIAPVVVEVTTIAVVLLRLDQPMLLATLLFAAVAYVAVFKASTRGFSGRARDVSSAILRVNAVLSDALLNVEVIKIFSAHSQVHERFACATEELRANWSRLHAQRAAISLASTATFGASVGASLFFAFDAVQRGSLTIGGFVLASVYMLQMTRPLELVGMAVRDLTQARAFLHPLLGVLREPLEEPPHEKAGPLAERAAIRTSPRPSSSPAISFRKVYFAYDGKPPLLKGLDLDIPSGCRIAIVGASGSGKTTLARLLLRLYSPQAGGIYIDGAPIDALPADSVRAMIGHVPQDCVLFNDTIAANIAIARRYVSRGDIEGAARLAHLHDFITSLPAGYETVVGARGLKLSGGERQRLAIARAAIRCPSLYLFDEATSMLDSQTEVAILRDFSELSAGCTTITIAHRLSVVAQADDIVVLDAGQIVERGNHAQLLANGRLYSNLWGRQMHSSSADASFEVTARRCAGAN